VAADGPTTVRAEADTAEAQEGAEGHTGGVTRPPSETEVVIGPVILF
jgi:hypothetical protein